MYLDKRRNDDRKEYTTEWEVLKEFDNSGKHTGKYKFRCKINGKNMFIFETKYTKYGFFTIPISEICAKS